jgi:hypothetical protein
MWTTSVISKKLPKVSNYPVGENSLNLVTRFVTAFAARDSLSELPEHFFTENDQNLLT